MGLYPASGVRRYGFNRTGKPGRVCQASRIIKKHKKYPTVRSQPRKHGRSTESITPEQLMEAILSDKGRPSGSRQGLIKRVAKQLVVHPHTIWNYRRRYPELEFCYLNKRFNLKVDMARFWSFGFPGTVTGSFIPKCWLSCAVRMRRPIGW